MTRKHMSRLAFYGFMLAQPVIVVVLHRHDPPRLMPLPWWVPAILLAFLVFAGANAYRHRAKLWYRIPPRYRQAVCWLGGVGAVLVLCAPLSAETLHGLIWFQPPIERDVMMLLGMILLFAADFVLSGFEGATPHREATTA